MSLVVIAGRYKEDALQCPAVAVETELCAAISPVHRPADLRVVVIQVGSSHCHLSLPSNQQICKYDSPGSIVTTDVPGPPRLSLSLIIPHRETARVSRDKTF